jgi:DNA polymerase III delta subunit
MSAALTPQSILEAELPPAMLYVADKEFLRRERFAKRFLDRFVHAKQRELVTFDGRFFGEQEFRSFQSSIRALSLFSEKKCIYIKYADEINAASLALISKEAAAMDSGTMLLCSGAPLQERSLFRKSFQRFYIAFEELKAPEMKRWMKKEFAMHGVSSVDEATFTLLSELSGGSLDKAAKLIENVSLYADGPQLTIKEATAYFATSKTASEFELLDAVLLDNKKKALELTTIIDMQGMNPYGFIPLIGKSVFHMLALLFAQREKYSAEKLRSRLGLSPWIMNKLMPAIKKHSEADACALQRATLRGEFRLKSKSLSPKDIIDSVSLRE